MVEMLYDICAFSFVVIKFTKVVNCKLRMKIFAPIMSNSPIQGFNNYVNIVLQNI